MKILKIACIAFSLSLSFLSIHAQKTDKEWAKFHKYAIPNKILMEETKQIDVVFMGNSITEGWYRLDSVFFDSNNYVGRGIGGQTTHQFLMRFRQDVINLRPKIVVINGGINDIAENSGAYNADFTFGNIVSMVELAQANNIKVILSSILPAAAFRWNPSITDAPEKVTDMNNRIEAYAQQHDITYVNYYPHLVAEGSALNPDYCNDGVHPILAGYKIMEPLIKKAIDSLID